MDSIDVRKLGADPTKFSWVEPPKVFSLHAEPAFFAPVSVSVGVRLAGGRVLVAGSASTKIRCECSRCLESFESVLSAEVKVEFREGTPPVQTVDEILDEEEEVSYFEPPFLSLKEDIRQILIVAVPDYPVCRTDCRGLCPVCGGNLNTSDCGHAPEAVKKPFERLSSLIPKEN